MNIEFDKMKNLVIEISGLIEYAKLYKPEPDKTKDLLLRIMDILSDVNDVLILEAAIDFILKSRY